MAAGLVSHNIVTAPSGGTFTVVSWVPNTATPDVGAVPVAMLSDGTLVAGIGPGVAANAIRVTPASDAGTLTVLQGANNGGTWQIEGKSGGTGNLLPVHIDPAQLGALVASAVPVISGGYDWLWIDANQAMTTLPSTVTGSYLEHLMCMVRTPATSQVLIRDSSGGTAREVLPDNVAGGVGTYILPIGVISKLGAWQVATNAGVTVIATFHV